MTTIPCPLQKSARLSPHSPAIISDNTVLNFKEFESRVEQMCHVLTREGIKARQRIGIIPENNVLTIITFFALWRIKAISCQLSSRTPIKSLNNQLKNLNCRTLLTPLSFKHKLSSTRIIPVKKLVIEQSLNTTQKHSFKMSQSVTIIYTSGSTATPKAVLHSLGNHYFSAKGSNAFLNFKKGDRWLLSLPLYHVGGISILFRAVVAQASVILPKQTQSLENTLVKHDITHLSLVPTQLFRLLRNKNSIRMLKQLKVILLGGGPIPEDLLKESLKNKLPIRITYGLTEMSSQVVTSEIITNGKSIRTRILPDRQCKITKDGEICVKGRTLAKGYVKGAKTTLPLDEQRWFHTGDRGAGVPNKDFKVLGRKDNMFISGGENIQPEEIEKCLLGITGVEKATIVPFKNEEFGSRPIAYIKMSSGKRLHPKQLKAQLAKVLPKFKVPDTFYPWPTNTRKNSLVVTRQKLATHI